jgi:nitrogen fixation protein NifB
MIAPNFEFSRTLDRQRHPCFSSAARGRHGRVHLPVAPACNVQCNFCNRKFDCANESRPGVCSALLKPAQVVPYVDEVLRQASDISVAGIAGPGDPFANAEETLESLRLLRQRFPELLLCVASNGLNVPAYLDQIAALGVSHFTITVNAVDPAIAADIYSWMNFERHMYRGREAGELLLRQQTAAIRGLKARGITVKINTIVIPSINDRHVSAVAEYAASLGADMLNCIPLHPTAETLFEEFPEPTATEMMQIRNEAEGFLPQMRHCSRCRADAVGRLGETPTIELQGALRRAAGLVPQERPEPKYAAVATWEGVLVNQHLGEATQLSIYEPVEGGGFRLRETRRTPEGGTGQRRWEELGVLLADCRALLVSGIGPSPRGVLEPSGLRIIEMEGLIDEGLRAVFDGAPVPAAMARKFAGCTRGTDCGGNGLGCG